MSHTTILIAEDNKRDSDDIASAAQQTGMTVRVYSFADLMETLKGPARFDLLILDLRMAGTDPHNTVEAVKLAIDRLNLPVIVVTGYPDEELQRDCEAYGWLWVPKDSNRFKADLYHAIDRALDRGEDSGERHLALKSSREQLAAIVSKLTGMEATLKAMQAQLDGQAGLMGRVADQMWGIEDPVTKFREGGCVRRHQQAMSLVNAGRVWLWAAVMGLSGFVSLIVQWLASQVTK